MLRRGLPGWTGQSLKQGGRVVGHHTEAFVGIDTSKLRNAVAVADSGRGGEVRYLGEFPATEAVIQKLGAKLAAKYRHLTFCYEAGPTGYGLYRLLKSLGHECLVVAPSLAHRRLRVPPSPLHDPSVQELHDESSWGRETVRCVLDWGHQRMGW
jgi:hypothetical protein